MPKSFSITLEIIPYTYNLNRFSLQKWSYYTIETRNADKQRESKSHPHCPWGSHRPCVWCILLEAAHVYPDVYLFSTKMWTNGVSAYIISCGVFHTFVCIYHTCFWEHLGACQQLSRTLVRFLLTQREVSIIPAFTNGKINVLRASVNLSKSTEPAAEPESLAASL